MSYKILWQSICQRVFKLSKMAEENEVVDGKKQQDITMDDDQNQSESQFQENTTATEVVTEDELTVLKNEINEQKDKYLRLFAEFDNYKKRNAKERMELFKTAGQDIIREMLPILDDFHRADKAFALDNNPENYANGVKLIHEKLYKTLQSKGLKAIESVGKEFNVAQHEAIAEVPAANDKQKGKIIDEVESGYTLNDSIIRYAKVVVGK
jgi:molecular chaperone GrpE